MIFFKKRFEYLLLSDVLGLTGSTVPSYISEKFERDYLALKIHGLASLKDAEVGDLSFLSNPKYVKFAEKTKASFCFVKQNHVERFEGSEVIPIINSDPYLAFALVLRKLYGSDEEILESSNSFIAQNSTIHNSAKIGKNVRIGANVFVAEGSVIGDEVTIMPNSFIGKNVTIGEKTIIHDNVSLMFCSVGASCIIRSGARIGTSGFGFVPNLKTGEHIYIPQVAGVVIGKNVDIGANTTIDRGCVENTVIGDNTKIDNLVQVGHGVRIGKSTFIAGQTGIAGSAEIGDFVFIGAQVGIAGHIKIADFTQIVGKSGVMEDITEVNTKIAGMPSMPKRKWERLNIIMKKLAFKS